MLFVLDVGPYNPGCIDISWTNIAQIMMYRNAEYSLGVIQYKYVLPVAKILL